MGINTAPFELKFSLFQDSLRRQSSGCGLAVTGA